MSHLIAANHEHIITLQDVQNYLLALHLLGRPEEANEEWEKFVNTESVFPEGGNIPTYQVETAPDLSTYHAGRAWKLLLALRDHDFPNTREDQSGLNGAYRSYLDAREHNLTGFTSDHPYNPEHDYYLVRRLADFTIGEQLWFVFTFRGGLYLAKEKRVLAQKGDPGYPERVYPADPTIWLQSSTRHLSPGTIADTHPTALREGWAELTAEWVTHHVTYDENSVTVADAQLIFRYLQESVPGEVQVTEMWMDRLTKNVFRRETVVYTLHSYNVPQERWFPSSFFLYEKEATYVLFPEGDDPETNPTKYYVPPQAVRYTEWPDNMPLAVAA